MGAKEQAVTFLKINDMHGDQIKFEHAVAEFENDMKNGLQGRSSSLMMLPAYITAERADAELNGKKVIVIDAGGTNLRVALCRFGGAKFEILSFEKHNMPGTQGKISADEFFDSIAQHLMPIIDKSDTVGFCFSYAAEMRPDKDGIVVSMGKEIEVDGIMGLPVCGSLDAALRRRGVRGDKKYVLLNDTVAAMMGACASHPAEKHESFMGFILGTGTNLCYSERCGVITKQPDIAASDGSMVINMESGGYDKFLTGTVDRRLDAQSVNPGEHIAEKLISGAYMANIVFGALQLAARQSMLSEKTCGALLAAQKIDMRAVDMFCTEKTGELAEMIFTDDDREFCYTVIDCLYARSAKIVAIELAATLGFSGHGRDPQRPVCVCAEGTMFYKSALLRPKLDEMIKKYLNEQRGLYLEFVSVDDATIIGSAMAALLNT